MVTNRAPFSPARSISKRSLSVSLRVAQSSRTLPSVSRRARKCASSTGVAAHAPPQLLVRACLSLQSPVLFCTVTSSFVPSNSFPLTRVLQGRAQQSPRLSLLVMERKSSSSVRLVSWSRSKRPSLLSIVSEAARRRFCSPNRSNRSGLSTMLHSPVRPTVASKGGKMEALGLSSKTIDSVIFSWVLP